MLLQARILMRLKLPSGPVPEKHTAVREFTADKDSPAFVCRFLEYQVWLTFGLYEVTGQVVLPEQENLVIVEMRQTYDEMGLHFDDL
jgi:hypothetical protein